MAQDVKLVIFDLGGVVVSKPSEYWAELEIKLGLPCHSIMKGLHNPEMKKLFQSAECGDGNAAEFEMTFSKFLLKTLKRTGENCFIPLISGFPQFMKPRKDVVQSVDSCRSREIKTCLLTNNFWLDGRLNSTVMWSNATEHFDYIVESAKVKLRKPDPAIFEYVMKLVNVSPAECIFLDDIQENIMAAKDLGIYAIKVDLQYQSAIEQLDKKLNG